jgi:acetyl-CoA acyltransferase 1
LKAIIDRTKIDPKIVDDIAVGNVLPPGGGATVARMAMLAAGFPDTVSVHTVNRQCSSGLQACAQIAAAIDAGFINIGIGAGVESMTKGYGPKAMPKEMSDVLLTNGGQSVADCLIPMGITSENVAKDYGVTREKQDRFSEKSHLNAANAVKNGKFDGEIVPVSTKVLDKDGKETQVTVTKDEGIRAETTFAGLSKLKPAFDSEGTTTAGNSSQVSDGAAAVLLMKRKTANKLKLPILGRFVGYAVAGVPPRVMGIGPAFAIPKVLEQTGLSKNDISVYEINEAFASQAVYCVEKLGLDQNKVNPNGGAIALGHPLGCTGARQIATLLPELKRSKGRYGVVSMCIGSGMGAAAVIESEQ